MPRYDALKVWLFADGCSVVPVTFAELDEVVVSGLPNSARRDREWWSNDVQRAQTRAWIHAGYKVESVDPPAGLVSFVHIGGHLRLPRLWLTRSGRWSQAA